MAKSKHRYSVHPSMRLVADWVEQLPKRTGRSLDEWIKHIHKDGPPEEPARRQWLKKSYKLGTNTCWWLTEKATRPESIEEDTPEGYLKVAPKYVEEQYGGKRTALRPIYNKLLDLGLGVGGT